MALDALLSGLESKFPDLLYVNDAEFYELINQGTLGGRRTQCSVSSLPIDRGADMYQEAL